MVLSSDRQLRWSATPNTLVSSLLAAGSLPVRPLAILFLHGTQFGTSPIAGERSFTAVGGNMR